MPLETNWRKKIQRFNSFVYCSEKDGSNSNSGLNESLPLQNFNGVFSLLNSLNTKSVQVRSGYYNEGDISLPSSFGGFIDFISDGNSIIDGSGFSSFISVNQQNSRILFNGFIFQNVLKYNDLGSTLSLQECFIKDSSFNKSSSSNSSFNINCSRASNCTFLRSDISISYLDNTVSGIVFRCTFFDSSLYVIRVSPSSIPLSNSFFNKNSSIELGFGSSINSLEITNCAFQFDSNGFSLDGTSIDLITLDGDLLTITNQYQEREKFSGSFTQNGFTYLFFNCFWIQDPLFNSVENEDFTLQNTPIQSILFNENNIIGSKGLAQYFTGLSEPFNPSNSNVILQNVTVDPVTGSFDLNSGQTEFRVRSTDDPTKCIEIPQATTLEKEVFFSMLGFSFFNGEWIQQLPFDSVSNRKVRLDFLISIYDESEPNGSNNPLNFSPFYDMEINQNIQLDSSMRGSGNIDADMQSLGNINGKRFIVDFIFRTDGI